MAQITTGFFSILSFPAVYNLFQILMGAKKGREKFVSDFLSIEAGSIVIDVGCGTAEILDYLPKDIDYYGFDISAEYINAAKKKFSSRNAHFKVSKFDEVEARKLAGCDLVCLSGVLHHLSDSEVKNIFEIVSSILNKGGKLVSVDPCFIDNQSMISRLLVSNDRGKNVRHIDTVTALARPYFRNVNGCHRNDFLSIPYDHVVLECGN